MATLDLAGIKKQLESSAKAFSTLSGQLKKGNTGNIPTLVPEVGQLNSALPSAIASINRAVKGIGTTIMGVSVSSGSAMEKLVKTLVPDVSGVKALADKASAKLVTTPGVSNPELAETCKNTSAEADKVSNVSTTTTATIASNNQVGPKQLPEMIAEINSASDVLGNYNNDLGTYLYAGGAAPTILTTVGDIKLDQLLTTAIANKDSAVDFSSGAIQGAVYKAAGIVREVNARYTSKSALYEQAVARYAEATKDMTSDAGSTVADMRGISPKQNEGI